MTDSAKEEHWMDERQTVFPRVRCVCALLCKHNTRPYPMGEISTDVNIVCFKQFSNNLLLLVQTLHIT
jgi:hypothetical protein